MVTKTVFSNGQRESVELAIEMMDDGDDAPPMPYFTASDTLDLGSGYWTVVLLGSLEWLAKDGDRYAIEALALLRAELNGLV